MRYTEEQIEKVINTASKMNKWNFLSYISILEVKANEILPYSVRYSKYDSNKDKKPAELLLDIISKLDTDFSNITEEVITTFIKDNIECILRVEEYYSKVLAYYSIVDDMVSALKKDGFEVETIEEDCGPSKDNPIFYRLAKFTAKHPDYRSFNIYPEVFEQTLSIRADSDEMDMYPALLLCSTLEGEEGRDYYYSFKRQAKHYFHKDSNPRCSLSRVILTTP